MRIDSMTLTNFRRFEYLEATFHPNLNVIVGESGAGKTTVWCVGAALWMSAAPSERPMFRG